MPLREETVTDHHGPAIIAAEALAILAIAIALTATACHKNPPPDNTPHRAAITTITPTNPAGR
jgi:hypothetical protein